MKSGLGLAAVALAALAGCAHDINYSKLPADTDPSREIDLLTQRVSQDKQSQVDVYAPDSFAKAQKSFDDTRQARASNASSADILENAAKADAYLGQAESRAKATQAALGEVASARTHAAEAGAPQFSSSSDEYAKADQKLATFTRDSDRESGVAGITDQERMGMLSQYKEAELHALVQKKLGHASAQIGTAIHEGAEKLAPKSLATAKAKYGAGVATIKRDPSDANAIQAASDQADQAADRLMKITRLAKASTNANPESLAASQYDSQNAIQDLEHQNDLVEQQKSALAGRGKLTAAVRDLKSKFNEDEAQVFEDGSQVHLRLKGLSFKSGSATIDPAHYALMGKVGQVLKETSPAQVEIDGRTDSVGSKTANEKLSKSRAEAVKEFLVAGSAVESDKVTTQGFGPTRPVASEKTKEGRALNRSIDVVMTPAGQAAGTEGTQPDGAKLPSGKEQSAPDKSGNVSTPGNLPGTS